MTPWNFLSMPEVVTERRGAYLELSGRADVCLDS